MCRTLRQPITLTLLALAAVVSCGTEPASGPVLPTRVVESGLCPNYYPVGSANTLYMAASEENRHSDLDLDLVPLPCSSADVRRDTTFDDCCRGWHYGGCTCAAGEDGALVWSCEQIAWDGVCEPPGELDPLPRASDFVRTWLLLFPSTTSLAGGACRVPPDAFLAGSCAPERYDVPQPISGCYDGAWYEGCTCETLNCLGLTWTCTSRRDEPRCPLAPEVE